MTTLLLAVALVDTLSFTVPAILDAYDLPYTLLIGDSVVVHVNRRGR